MAWPTGGSSILRAGRGHAREKHVKRMCQKTKRLQAWGPGIVESRIRFGEGAHSEQISNFTAQLALVPGSLLWRNF